MEAQIKKEYGEKWFDMILKNKDKISNFGKLGYNLLLTDEMVLNNLNENWDWYVLMNFNNNITIKKDLQKNNYIRFPPFYDVKIVALSGEILESNKIKKITLGEIIEQMNCNVYTDVTIGSYYFSMLSMNENITLKLIKDNLDKPWYWDYFCVNEFKNDCKNYIIKCIKKVLLTKILKSKKIS